MSHLSPNHVTLSDGVGKCSAPMWMGGMPAGFCDRPAYGKRDKSSRYDGYVPGLACDWHGGPQNPEKKDAKP